MTLTIHVDGEIYARQPHGGISRVFDELLKALHRRKDVEVHLHLPDGVDAGPRGLIVAGVHAIPSGKPFRGERFFGDLFHAVRNYRTRRYWSRLSRGIFISTYYTHPDGLVIPTLVLVHDMIYERYPQFFSRVKDARHVGDKARCTKQAAALVTPSQSAMHDLVSIRGDDRRLTRVIPYAVSETFYRARDVRREEQIRVQFIGGHEYLLFSGARGGHKNFKGLLEAYAAAGLGDAIHLLAVGGGAPTGEEAMMIERLGIGNRVHFAGSLGDDDIVTVVQAARAVVVPSFCEGYGFPLIEAMAAGRPVASSTGGSLPEVGQDAPVYFDPHVQASMVDALRVIVNVDDRDPRIARGLAIAHARTWDDVASDYIQLASRLPYDL